MITEKQAAQYCQRTLENAAKRLQEQAANMGQTFPILKAL